MWKHGGEWSVSLLTWTAFSRMYEDGRDCNPMFFEFKNGSSIYYQKEEELVRVKEDIKKRAKKDPRFIEHKLIALKKQIDYDTAQLKTINRRLKNKNADLAKLFRHYWDLFGKTIFGMAIDIYFDDILCNQLSEFLKNKLARKNKQEEFNNYYASLTAPIKITTTQKEEIDFLKVLLKEKKERKKLFNNHLNKYSYIPMWCDSNPWNHEDLQRRAKPYRNKREIIKRLEILEKETARRKKEISIISSELKLPKEILDLIKDIQQFSFLRQQGEVQISYHNFSGLELKEKICDKLSINMAELRFLTDKEIIENLKKLNPSLKKIIAERKKYCFMVMEDGEYSIYTGEKAKDEANKIKSQIEESKVDINKTLKGIVGSIGLARGTIRVLYRLEDIKKVNESDIMVVSGTSLEYLPAMQKASAVIAEIGGITSHAAVVCRELRKPCLTRVSDATKILKDGDFVEVDANKGIIKKIN